MKTYKEIEELGDACSVYTNQAVSKITEHFYNTRKNTGARAESTYVSVVLPENVKLTDKIAHSISDELTRLGFFVKLECEDSIYEGMLFNDYSLVISLDPIK